jgi:predicted DsbA family dithiol-disulfide isomerase
VSEASHENGTAAPALTIEIHFDLVCPWCFIGKRQLAARALDWFAHDVPGVAVAAVWVPVQLLPGIAGTGCRSPSSTSGAWARPRLVRQRRQQVALAARSAGLELDLSRDPAHAQHRSRA